MTGHRPIRRVFLGLTEVSGHYANLAAGLRTIGMEVTYVNLAEHAFAYGGDDSIRLGRWARAVSRWRRQRGPIGRVISGIVLLMLRFALLIWALRRFDAFVFGFATSFLYLYDLPILRLFGKRVLFQFHGSDSRPPYLDGGVVTPGTDWKPATVLRRTRRQQRNVAWIDRWSDIVVDNPTSGHFHRKPFVIWLRVGLPVSPHEPKPMPTGDGLEFLHCPSMPTLKGSDRITLAVEAVAATGRAVALRTLTNVPNTTVRQALDECAGVIDQAYSDYAMPGFATESAWHARPVIIAGYAVEHWERWLPEDARPPTLFVHPDAIERTLTQLVDDPAERQATGLRAREFVSNNWRPDLVARRMLRLLEGDVPSEWLFDPNNTDYVHGCGLSEEAAIAAGRRLLERYGPDAFCVNDKPALRQLLVEFYGKERTPLRVD